MILPYVFFFFFNKEVFVLKWQHGLVALKTSFARIQSQALSLIFQNII